MKTKKELREIEEEMDRIYKEKGLNGLLKMTARQKQNPRYHSFDVGGHRKAVERAITQIAKKDEDAKELLSYGFLHDIAKGFTTTYKETGEPQEIHHEKVGSNLLKKWGYKGNLLFAVKNHHFFSNYKINVEEEYFEKINKEYGKMDEETNIEQLTEDIMEAIKMGEIREKKNYKKIVELTYMEVKEKEEAIKRMKLLGYALIADALGGFKSEIAYGQFFKAQMLIRIRELIDKDNLFWNDEDKEERLKKEVLKIKIEELSLQKEKEIYFDEAVEKTLNEAGKIRWEKFALMGYKEIAKKIIKKNIYVR